jgi:hypothetical protein
MARAVNRTALLLVGLAMGALLAGCQQRPTAENPPATQQVVINGQRFELELALTSQARYQGLSDRPSIPDDGGMLFVFPNAAPRVFVMRRCRFPIDLIYLGGNGRVVAMHRMSVEEDPDAPEWRLERYPSTWPAQFAIELKGGTLDRLGLKLGEAVDLPLESLKRLAR